MRVRTDIQLVFLTSELLLHKIQQHAEKYSNRMSNDDVPTCYLSQKYLYISQRTYSHGVGALTFSVLFHPCLVPLLHLVQLNNILFDHGCRTVMGGTKPDVFCQMQVLLLCIFHLPAETKKSTLKTETSQERAKRALL